MRLRRRKSPGQWTDTELTEQIRAVYTSTVEFVPEAHGAVNLAGVVFHQDARLFPRHVVWATNRYEGGFVPYCFYGVWWNDYLRTSVNMGDSPVDTFRCYSGHQTEQGARDAAKQWLDEDGDTEIVDLAFNALPAFAQSMVQYVLRHGPGHFR